MSFGLFVHKFDISGKLYDGATSNESNRLATRSYVDSAVSQGAGDYLASVNDSIEAAASAPTSPTDGDKYLAAADDTGASWTENNVYEWDNTNGVWVETVSASGDRYRLTASAGSFVADSIYEFDGSSWTATAPTEGTHIYDEDTDESLIYNGSAWVLLVSNLGALKVSSDLADLNDPAIARSNLGLGSLAVLSSLNLGSSTELQGTLPITRGGTGATTDTVARTNLGLGSIATQDANNVDIDGGTIDDTDITLGSSNTLDVSAGTMTFASGQIANASLANASMTIAGQSVALGGSITADTIAGQISAGQITNAQLVNDSVSFGGVSLDLGQSDATPAFDLADATNLPISTGVAGLGTDIATALGNALDADLASVSTNDDTLASAKAIKAYVDAQVGGSDLDFQGDSGGALSIDLDSEVLDIAGDGVAISTAGSGNQITISAANASTSAKGVASFTSTDFSVSNGVVSLVDLTVSHMDAAAVALSTGTGEGIANNNNDTSFPTSAAVKAYVDTQVGASALTISGDLGGTEVIDLDSETLSFAGGNGIITSMTSNGNEVGFQVDTTTVATLADTQTLTNKTLTSPDINGGTLEDAAITLGVNGSLDASAGSLTTSAAQNAAIVQGAAADLDIGDFELRAQDLVADSLTEGQVVFAGVDGKLVDDADLTFSGDTLTATKIGAFQAAGAINFASQQMTNVDINSGVIDDTPIGLSTPSSGAFTTLSASGSASMSGTLGVAGTTQLGVLNATGAVSFTDTLAVTGESTFSDGLFPNSATATVDLGGMQGTTSEKQAWEWTWFEDSNFTDASEGTSLVYPAYDSNGYAQFTYFKDSGFTVANPSPYNSPLTTTNDPVSVAYYSDTTFTTQIVAPNSGTMRAVILTWNAADYPSASERAGDGVRWDQVYFPNKFNGMNTNTLVWDTANYQAKIEFGGSGQLIDSTWHGTAVKLRNNSKDSSHVEITFPANQGLTAAKILADGEFRSDYNVTKTMSSVSLVSGQTFRFTLGSSVSASDTGNTPGVIFAAESDIPSLYLELGFADTSGEPAPQTASEISAILMGDYNNKTTLQTSSIVLDRVDNSSSDPYYYYRITFSSVPTSYTSSLYFYAAVGSQELRYFQDISAKRAMRIKSLGSGSAPTSNGTGDSALYVKQCPVNYSGSHADELFYLDAAGNTIQFTEGGHVFAPRRAMDATEVLAEDADLSSLPVLASSLKECYAFDLSAKAGSPALGSSSQAQALTIPVPQAADIGREVKIIVLGSMSSANQLTINAGTYTNSASASITGQIDGLDAVVLSQPYQVIKLLAIKAQDDAASADITCWKLV